MECRNCGKEFESSNELKQYCSDKCRRQYYKTHGKEQYKYICLNCGKEYHAKEKDRSKYCSRECAYEHRAKVSKQKVKPTKTKKDKIYSCKNCGKELKKYRKYCIDCAEIINKQKYQERLEKDKKQKVVKQCAYCGNCFETSYSRQIYCCNDCGKKASYTSETKREERRRYRARKINAYVSKVVTKEIFERDNGICQICGELIDLSLSYPHPLSLSLDHTIPLALGGTHEPDNVQASHFICNSYKSNNIETA